MADIFAVAAYIIDKKGPMSPMKLQRLCFYAQAWTMAWEGKKLFKNDFELMGDLPVCRELYIRFSGQLLTDKLKSAVKLKRSEKENVDIILKDYQCCRKAPCLSCGDIRQL